MIDWREAQARLFALAPPVSTESVSIAEAAGRWTSEPVRALRTQPDSDLSAMDGYAIRHADLPGPWRVVGEAAAGRPMLSGLGQSEAARIFTGSQLPEGADTILIQENATQNDNVLALTGEAPTVGQWVRPRGADFGSDRVIIAAGLQLNAARIGLAVLAGHSALRVRRRIRVAIASTGDELRSVLPDSNGPMLAALLSDMPVELTRVPAIPDDRTALADFFGAHRDHDVIVTTGGASVGDHDLIRPVLLDFGAKLDFWKVAMRPGKPVLAGTLDDAVVLGLPGNPGSAFVTAHVFLRPLIAHLSGAVQPCPTVISAVLGAPLPAVGVRTDFERMCWKGGTLVPASAGDSGALLPLAEAQALVIREAQSPMAQPNEVVNAIPIA